MKGPKKARNALDITLSAVTSTVILPIRQREDGLIKDYSGNPVSKDELMDNLKIRFITMYRDGSIAYSLDHHCTLDTESDVHIVYAVNGDISIKSDSEFYGFG